MPAVKTVAAALRRQASRKGVIAFLVFLLALAVPLVSAGLFGTASLPLDAGRAAAMVGELEILEDGMALRLDSKGAALLRFDLNGEDPTRLPFFRFELAENAAVNRLLFFGRSVSSAEPFTLGVAEGTGARAVAPYFGGDGRWTSDVIELFVGIEGRPGASIRIDRATLGGATPASWLGNLRWGLAKPEQWTLRSVNVAVPGNLDLVFLGPVAALSLLVAGLSVPVLFAAFAARASALPVLALIFLAGWLVLDLTWFRQQLHNAHAGVVAATMHEKRLGLPLDHATALSRFAGRVDDAVPAGASQRILVGSADEFRGMRAAYHLYPRNVYWERGRELPSPAYLKKGDFLLIVRPSRHSVQGGVLRHPDWEQPGPRVRAVLADEPGTLLVVR